MVFMAISVVKKQRSRVRIVFFTGTAAMASLRHHEKGGALSECSD